MIRNIIVVDDSDMKRSSICGYMRTLFPDAIITEYDCVAPFAKDLHFVYEDDMRSDPDSWLIVSDMYMPLRHGEAVDPNGGRLLISEIARLDLQCPVIVASSEEIYDMDYEINYLGSVVEDVTVYTLSSYKELLMGYLS